jgi:hypothetical protein
MELFTEKLYTAGKTPKRVMIMNVIDIKSKKISFPKFNNIFQV